MRHTGKLSASWNVWRKEVKKRSFNSLREWFDIVMEMLSLYIIPSECKEKYATLLTPTLPLPSVRKEGTEKRVGLIKCSHNCKTTYLLAEFEKRRERNPTRCLQEHLFIKNFK
jgi:hypothetical protein